MDSAPESVIEMGGEAVDDELELSLGDEIIEFIIDLIIWLESSFPIGIRRS